MSGALRTRSEAITRYMESRIFHMTIPLLYAAGRIYLHRNFSLGFEPLHFIILWSLPKFSYADVSALRGKTTGSVS